MPRAGEASCHQPVPRPVLPLREDLALGSGRSITQGRAPERPHGGSLKGDGVRADGGSWRRPMGMAFKGVGLRCAPRRGRTSFGAGGPGWNKAARLPQAQPERRDSPSDHQLQARRGAEPWGRESTTPRGPLLVAGRPLQQPALPAWTPCPRLVALSHLSCTRDGQTRSSCPGATRGSCPATSRQLQRAAGRAGAS